MGWSKGFAEWVEDGTAHLSIVFTWELKKAYSRAVWHRAQGLKVRAGGPALFHPRMRAVLEGVAEIGGDLPDVVSRHNPLATFASRGCPVNCWFCIVPPLEGTTFTLEPDFLVRPVLCDSNLSALPVEYQDHIIGRYQAEGVELKDACQGFEPLTFDGATFERWRRINRGPWRFAYDELAEREPVREMFRILEPVRSRLKRVYVLIGNEPFEDCMRRIQEVIDWGGEPHVQPFIKLTALEKVPDARHDWTVPKLRAVARWANRFIWRKIPFDEYDRTSERQPAPYRRQTGLFELANEASRSTCVDDSGMRSS